MAESYQSFISAHLGKGVDYDMTAGVQCVDLIKAYLAEVFGIRPGTWGDARYYYERFKDPTWPGYRRMNAAFVRLPNTPEFVPQKGDICVWGPDVSDSHDSGHISIANGTGNTSYFYTHDQNWNGKNMKLVKHGYRAFYGVLRPRDRSRVEDTLTGSFTVTASALNLRTGPGVNYPSAGLLENGEKVTVTEKSGNWSKLSNGLFVYTAYLKKD